MQEHVDHAVEHHNHKRKEEYRYVQIGKGRFIQDFAHDDGGHRKLHTDRIIRFSHAHDEGFAHADQGKDAGRAEHGHDIAH